MNFYEFVKQVDKELLDNNLTREDVEIVWIDVGCDGICEIEIVRVNGEIQLRVT
jgi:hypothetical protein